jgi:t-SNARE complex subunit (syntaxin)
LQRDRREKQQQLSQRFKTESKQFTQSVKATQASSRRTNDHAAHATEGGGQGGQGVQLQEEMLLDSHAIEHQRAIFREREEEARRLAEEMSTLQDIMGDLSQQVAEQGDMVDDIEGNTTSAEQRADKGVEHLEKASLYQKIFTGRAMWLVAILLLIAGAVTAIVVLTNKK